MTTTETPAVEPTPPADPSAAGPKARRLRWPRGARSASGDGGRRLRLRRPRLDAPLVLLLVVAAIGATAWSFVVPPMEGPDEEAHVAYVQRMVDDHSLPQNVDPAVDGYSTELEKSQFWAQLYQVATNPAIKPLLTDAERKAYDRDIAKLPEDGRRDGRGYQAAASYPPLYYAYASVPYAVGTSGTLFTRVQLMRLAGIPLLLVVVWMTWLLAAELLPRPYWARVLAAGVVSVQPVLSFISGMVNPDIMLAAEWSVFLVVALRAVKYGPTWPRVLTMGAMTAASALTQPRGLTLSVPLAVCFLLACWWHKVPVKEILRRGIPAAVMALAGIVIYYVVVSVTGTSETAGQINAAVTDGGFNVREFLSYVWQFYFPKWDWMDPMLGPPRGWRYVYVESFFGVFGQIDTFFPAWVYERMHSYALYAVIMFITCFAVRWPTIRLHRRELSVLVVTSFTLLFTLHFAAYKGLKANGGIDPILVGRYLFPIITLFGLACAFMATTFPRRIGICFAVLLLSAGILLQIGGLGAALGRFHA